MKKELKQKSEINTNDFTLFVIDIKQKILSSQYEALKAVNKELISLYWDIGKDIVEKQKVFNWGKSVVKNLSDELQKAFVGAKGFSERNLWNMRNFYITYKETQKLQTLSAEIGWSHNVAILQKCKEKKRTTAKYALNETSKRLKFLLGGNTND